MKERKTKSADHVWLVEGNDKKFKSNRDDEFKWASKPKETREEARAEMRKQRRLAKKKYATRAYKFRVVKYVFEKADVGP